MKSILLLTDSSSAARRAALLASFIAGKTCVRLLTVNLENTDKPVPAVDYALVAKNASGVFIAKPVDNSVEKQKAISHADHTFQQGDDVSLGIPLKLIRRSAAIWKCVPPIFDQGVLGGLTRYSGAN